MKHEEIRVYEYVYEYGQKSGANDLKSYSYTYSYTPISPSLDIQRLPLLIGEAAPIVDWGGKGAIYAVAGNAV